MLSDNSGRIAGSLHECAEFVLKSITEGTAVIKLIATEDDSRNPLEVHWDFYLNQFADPVNNRPVKHLLGSAQRNQVYNPKTNTWQYRNYRNRRPRGLAKTNPLHRTTKKTSASLFLGKMKHFSNVKKPIGLLFHLPWCDHKDERFVFKRNAGTNNYQWILGQPSGYLNNLKQYHITIDNLINLISDLIKKDVLPDHNELLLGLCKEALMAVFATEDTPESRLNALHKQLYVEKKLGIRLPILIIDGLNDPREYTPDELIEDLQQLTSFQNLCREIMSLLPRVASYGFHLSYFKGLLNMQRDDLPPCPPPPPSKEFIYEWCSIHGISPVENDDAAASSKENSHYDDIDKHVDYLISEALKRKNHILIYQLIDEFEEIDLSQLLNRKDYPELALQLLLLAIEDDNPNVYGMVIVMRDDLLDKSFFNGKSLQDFITQKNKSGLKTQIQSYIEEQEEATNSTLWHAVLDRNNDLALDLLNTNPRINIHWMPEDNQITSFELAVSGNQPKVVNLLLNKPFNVDPNYLSHHFGITLTQHAFDNRYDKVFSYLLKKGGRFTTIKENDDAAWAFLDIMRERMLLPKECFSEILNNAIRDNKPAWVHWLLEQGVDKSFISRAVEKDRWDIVALFANYNADKGAIESYRKVLLIALEEKQFKVAICLLQNNANLKPDELIHDNINFMPLHFAVAEGHLALIEIMLSSPHNVNPNIRVTGRQGKNQSQNNVSPTTLAFKNRNIGATQLLLKHGGEIPAESIARMTDSQEGWDFLEMIYLPYLRKHYDNLLYYAAEDNKQTLVEQLLKQDVNLSIIKLEGATPISIAAKMQHWNIVRAIAKQPTDAEDKAKYWWAVFWAVKAQQYQLALQLLNNDTNIKVDVGFHEGTNKGLGILHFTVQDFANPLASKLAKCLLKRGVNPNKNFAGKASAMDLAFATGNTKARELLQQFGGKISNNAFLNVARSGDWGLLISSLNEIPKSIYGDLLVILAQDERVSSGNKLKWMTWLLEHGAIKDVVNKEKTAIESLAEQKAWELVDVFTNYRTSDTDTSRYSRAIKLAVQDDKLELAFKLMQGLHNKLNENIIIQLTRFPIHDWRLLPMLRNELSTFMTKEGLGQLLINAIIKSNKSHVRSFNWIAFLLEKGADTKQTYHGVTAIQIAAHHASNSKNWDIVKEFIKFIADDEDKSRYSYALFLAVQNQQYDLACQLLPRIKSIDLKQYHGTLPDTNGYTLLHFSVLYKWHDFVRNLLEKISHISDINFKEKDGENATELALRLNQQEFVTLLMDLGGTVDNKVLGTAAGKGNWALINSIKNKIPRKSYTQLMANSALFLPRVVDKSFGMEVLQYLVDRGADATHKCKFPLDNDEYTDSISTLDYCLLLGFFDLLNIILTKNINMNYQHYLVFADEVRLRSEKTKVLISYFAENMKLDLAVDFYKDDLNTIEHYFNVAIRFINQSNHPRKKDILKNFKSDHFELFLDFISSLPANHRRYYLNWAKEQAIFSKHLSGYSVGAVKTLDIINNLLRNENAGLLHEPQIDEEAPKMTHCNERDKQFIVLLEFLEQLTPTQAKHRDRTGFFNPKTNGALQSTMLDIFSHGKLKHKLDNLKHQLFSLLHEQQEEASVVIAIKDNLVDIYTELNNKNHTKFILLQKLVSRLVDRYGLLNTAPRTGSLDARGEP